MNRIKQSSILLVLAIGICLVAFLAVAQQGKEPNCLNVYVDGKRVGTILHGCEMREYTTFTRLPAGSELEIKEEDYETAYITYLALVRFKGRGARKTLKREEFLLDNKFMKFRYVFYVKLSKGSSMKFRHRIKDGDYLKAIGWYEPAK